MYDLIIVGGGVSGTSLLWAAVLYAFGVSRVLLIERRRNVGLVNSNASNNSQTLHDSSIETNYGLLKGLRILLGAKLMEAFLRRFAPHAYRAIQKMVIGVGEKEAVLLRERFKTFRPYFPEMRLLEGAEIAEYEPNVMKERDPRVPVVALYSPHGLAVDYHALSEAFLKHALENRRGITVDVKFEEDVESITRTPEGFVIRVGGTPYRAKAVAVAAGSNSLNFAHQLGYGLNYGIMPVAGDFFRADALLQGKVYTVQIEGIPFAAVHGDPNVYNSAETRFGPTAKPLPQLERHSWQSFWEFLRTGTVSIRGVVAIASVLLSPRLFFFGLKNLVYALPIVGKYAFLRQARKVVPSLKASDLTLEKGAGGVRGQLVDLETRQLASQADRIMPEDGAPIIFTMAPSPGASYSLANALEVLAELDKRTNGALGFDRARIHADLGVETEIKQAA